MVVLSLGILPSASAHTAHPCNNIFLMKRASVARHRVPQLHLSDPIQQRRGRAVSCVWGSTKVWPSGKPAAYSLTSSEPGRTEGRKEKKGKEKRGRAEPPLCRPSLRFAALLHRARAEPPSRAGLGAAGAGGGRDGRGREIPPRVERRAGGEAGPRPFV